MKDRILEHLSFWHDEDFETLMLAIENANLGTPCVLGQAKILNEFKGTIKKHKKDY